MTPLLLFLATTRIITLEDALASARNHPQLAKANANVDESDALRRQARSPLLPQIVGTASYQRTTANFTARPGIVPVNTLASRAPSYDTFNFFNFGVTLSQLVYDFGRTSGLFRAAASEQAAAEQDRISSGADVAFAVREAYFQAGSAQAQKQVAAEALAMRERFVGYMVKFVEAGSRPAVDLATAEAERAQAQLDMVTASKAEELAKRRLTTAMGLDRQDPFDVADEGMAVLDVERDAAGDPGRTAQILVDEMFKRSPVLRAMVARREAEEARLRSSKGLYGPSISVGTGFTEVGPAIDRLTWNWNASANLSWTLFGGLGDKATIEQGEARVRGMLADERLLRQNLIDQSEQALTGLRAAKEAVKPSDTAVTSSKERVRLAEGRFTAGLGSTLELDDAQDAWRRVAAQAVVVRFDVALARAAVLHLLGQW